jgi:hypothetical protein
VSIVFCIIPLLDRDDEWAGWFPTVVRYSWAMHNELEEHFERIKQRLGIGAQKLRDMAKSHERWQTADVPNVSVDQTFINAEPPRDGDK